MIVETQRAKFDCYLKQDREQLDFTGPEYLQRLRRALRAMPTRQIEFVPCPRCGELREWNEPNREKRPHRSDGDGDLCPACVLTHFLLSAPDLTACLRAAMGQQGRHILLRRDFQQVLGAFFLAATADSDFPLQDVDWRKVRDRWDLI